MRRIIVGTLLLVALSACGVAYYDRPSPYVRNRLVEGRDYAVAGDRERAAAQYDAAAATGDPFGEYRAARFYSSGPRATRDDERAIALLRSAIEKRSAVQNVAKIRLARLIGADEPEAALALLREADAGGAAVPPGVMAALLIANGYPEEAEPWLAAGREQEDLRSLQISVDQALDAGDRAAAREYGTQLAEAYRELIEVDGRTQYAWALATLYARGEAVPADIDEAIGWYEVAAEAGDVRATRVLARGFLEGTGGFPVDPVAGRRWAERGVAAGDAASATYLGRALLTGDPLPQDTAEGVALLQRAADQGDRDAMTDLGRAFVDGADVPRDLDRGIALLETAAAEGSSSALVTLGALYWRGDGVPRSPERGLGYMQRAADLGHPYARQFVAENG